MGASRGGKLEQTKSYNFEVGKSECVPRFPERTVCREGWAGSRNLQTDYSGQR